MPRNENTTPVGDGTEPDRDTPLSPLRRMRLEAIGDWITSQEQIFLDPGFFEVCRTYMGMDRTATELAINDATRAGLISISCFLPNESSVPCMALQARTDRLTLSVNTVSARAAPGQTH